MGKKLVNANTLTAKNELMVLIEKLGSTRTKQETNEWLTLNLGTDLFCAWIVFDNNKATGLLLAEAIENDSAFVAMDWAKGGTGKEGLLEKLELWAKNLGLKKLIKYTNKSPTTFIKKHGWSVWQTVLVKEL